MDELAKIFDLATAERVFPGAVVYLACEERIYANKAFATTAYDNIISRLATIDTLYDLASITKLWTATAFLIAARENGISLETPLWHFVSEFDETELREVTPRHLLNHTNGLHLHIQSLTHVSPDEWLGRIAQAGLTTPPGQQVRYTCTAYFILGKLIEQWSGMTLDQFMGSRLIEPLGLQRTLYNPLSSFATEAIAPTEIDEATGEPWRGVVHDEAARALGGVSGNAGLFSTAADLGRFAQMWLNNGAYEGRQLLHPEDAHRALFEAVPAENFRQGLGWHLDVSSWMSPHAPAGTAGHLGFTGPSLFISPERHICIVLNNRVYPTRAGPVRLKYLRSVAEWLFAVSGTKAQ
jgi:CubicO group peptidase (beta-lactamase class C family)